MTLSRRLFAAGLVASAGSGRAFTVPKAAAEGTDSVDWGEFVSHVNSTQTKVSTSFSPDKTSASIIFDRLSSRALGSVLASSAYYSGHYPLQLGENRSIGGIFASVRGAVGLSEKGRAILHLGIAGVSRTLEWPYAEERNYNYVTFIASPVQRDRQQQGQILPPLPPLTISIDMHVEMLESNDQVLLTVDSIDIALAIT